MQEPGKNIFYTTDTRPKKHTDLILALEEVLSASGQLKTEHVRAFGVIRGDGAGCTVHVDRLLVVEVGCGILGTDKYAKY